MSDPDPRTLTDEDLLARLLGSRVREGLGLRELATAEAVELRRIHRLTPAQLRRATAAREFLRRLEGHPLVPPAKVDTPESVYELMRLRALTTDVEHFWCLALDARARLIGDPVEVSRGDVDGTDAGPRAFFRSALVRRGVSAIAVHNHPTGDPHASAGDHAVTERLAAAGQVVDIAFLDHVIIAAQGFVSLRREHPELFKRK